MLSTSTVYGIDNKVKSTFQGRLKIMNRIKNGGWDFSIHHPFPIEMFSIFVWQSEFLVSYWWGSIFLLNEMANGWKWSNFRLCSCRGSIIWLITIIGFHIMGSKFVRERHLIVSVLDCRLGWSGIIKFCLPWFYIYISYNDFTVN